MLYRSFVAIAAHSLVVALASCETSPRPEDLHRNVVAQNADSVRALLELGVDPTRATAEGEIPFHAALVAVTGPARYPGFSLRARFEDDSPALAVLRDIMRHLRQTSHTAVDLTGPLTLTMQEVTGQDGQLALAWTAFVSDSAVRYELAVSGWETTFDGIERPDGWNPLLRPGTIYRVVGAARDGRLEAYEVAMVGEPTSTNAMRFPIGYFLPSTFDSLRAHTWLGRRSVP